VVAILVVIIRRYEKGEIMSSIKFATLATIAILLGGGVFATASAQKVKVGPIPLIEPLNGTYAMKVNANELSSGDSEYAMQETYGWTCYGKTNGDLSGFMFISMNYTVPEKSDSRVTGGSWSKLIFINGQYVGSVYGKIVGGTIVWSDADLTAKMSLELSADDGTGAYLGSIGKGRFDGMLDRTGKTGTISGALTLSY
jgi:hypothetical protein